MASRGGDKDDVMSEIQDKNMFYDADDDGSVMTISTFADAEEKGDLDHTGGGVRPTYDALNVIIKDLKGRLSRRNGILEDVRVAYLRDVVAVKHWIKNVLTDGERSELFRQVDEFMPSIDLNGPLILHGPKDAEFRLKPCLECGGRIDIVLNDNKTVIELKSKLATQKELEENIRLQVATTEALFEKLTKESSDERRSHEEEKRFMFTEMKRIKETTEKVNIENKNIKEENIKVKDREAAVKKENQKLKDEITRISVFEQKYYDCEKEVTTLKTSLRHSETAVESQKVEIEKQSKEILESANERKRLEGEVKHLYTEVADQKQKLYRFKESNDSLQKALTEKETDVLSLRMNLNSNSDELNDLKYQSAADLQKLESMCDEVRDQLINTEASLRAQKKATFAAEQVIKEKDIEIKNREKLLLEREDEITDLAADCESFEEEIEALKMFLQQSFGGAVEIPDFAAMIAADKDDQDEGSSTQSESSNYQDEFDDTSPNAIDNFSQKGAGNLPKAISSSTDDALNNTVNFTEERKLPTLASAGAVENHDVTAPPAEESSNVGGGERSTPTNGNTNINNNINDNNVYSKSDVASDVADSNINSDDNSRARSSSIISNNSHSNSPSQGGNSSPNGNDNDANSRSKKREVVAKKSRGRRAMSITNNEDADKIRNLIRNSGRAVPPTPDGGGDSSFLDGVEEGGEDEEGGRAFDGGDNQKRQPIESIQEVTSSNETKNDDRHEKKAERKKETQHHHQKERSERHAQKETLSTTTAASITTTTTSGSGVEGSTKTKALNDASSPRPTRHNEPRHASQGSTGAAAKDEKKTQVKTKAKVAQMVMPVEISVELDPPPADSSPEELKFRDVLLPLLGFTLGPNASKKAMNAMSALIHEQFTIQLTSIKTLWDTLLLLKRNNDFMTKIKVVLDGFLSLAEKKNSISGIDIASIVTEIVPIAGNMLGTKLTPKWRDESKINEVLVQFLIPNVDPNTGEFIYLKYQDYLKVNQNELKRTVDSLESEVEKFFDYADEQLSNINEKIILHIRDWTYSKTEMSQIETRLEKQNETVSKDFNLIISGLQRDIATLTAKFDMAKASAKQLETKCEDMTMMVSRLEKYQPMYEKLEKETKTFREDKEALKRIIKEAKQETADIEAKLYGKTVQCETVATTLKSTEEALAIEAQKCVDWEIKYHNMTSWKERLEKEIADIHEKAAERLRNMKAVSTQVELIMSTSDTQTDFLTTSMTLKPLVGKVKGSKVEKSVYAAVQGEDPTEEYTRRRVLENPDMQHLVNLNNLEFKIQKRPVNFDDEIDFEGLAQDSCAVQGVIDNEKELDAIVLNSPDPKNDGVGDTHSVDYSHYDSKVKNKEKLIYKSLIKAQKRLLFSKSRGEGSELLDPVVIHRNLQSHDKQFLSQSTLNSMNKFEFFDSELNPKAAQKRVDLNAVTNSKLTASISLELPSISKLGSSMRLDELDGDQLKSSSLAFSLDDASVQSERTQSTYNRQGGGGFDRQRKQSLDSISINDSIDTAFLTSPGSLESKSRTLSSLLKLDADDSLSDLNTEIAQMELNQLITRNANGTLKGKTLHYPNKLQVSNAASLPGSKVDFVIGGTGSQQLNNRRKVGSRERSIPFFQDQLQQQLLDSESSISSIKTKASKSSLIADLRSNFFG